MPSSFHGLIRRKPPGAATKKKKKKKKRKRSAIAYPKMEPELRPEVEEVEDEEDEEDMEEGAEVLGFKLKPSAYSRLHAIQPLGNLLLLGGPSSSANARDVGLGALRILPDDLLLDVLTFLPARDLAVLSSTSRSLYVFATHDPLWRALVLERFRGDFLFCGSWRSTYLASASRTSPLPPSETLVIRNFYSDYLFQSWLCASIEMKPEWLKIDNIERRRGISVEEFIDTFEDPNKPVLLQGCLDTWPAMERWNRERLVRICGDVKFAVGPVEMTMERYFQYSDAAKEERPLYLFDPKFADKVLELGYEYEVPIYFREDLFSVLGKERPDYRWIIIGPAGSGSSFHVDPNSTSAWNAVIKGSKKWIMFPPEIVPPGVHPSADGAEVASPVSIMEWFMNFYAACRTWKKRPVECVCRAGEVIFVPKGWWHLVVNLEDSIAITQNYVSRSNLLNVLDFLQKPNARELVSGTKDRVNLFEKFKTAIDASFPEMIDEVTAKVQEKMAEKKRPSFWESVTDAKAGGFKFSLI